VITEAVHHRNLTREFGGISTTMSFEWTRFLRFYIEKDTLKLRIGDAHCTYSFEYLGLSQSLVRTPLSD
jgi:hypothetical protein